MFSSSSFTDGKKSDFGSSLDIQGQLMESGSNGAVVIGDTTVFFGQFTIIDGSLIFVLYGHVVMDDNTFSMSLVFTEASIKNQSAFVVLTALVESSSVFIINNDAVVLSGKVLSLKI